MDSPSRTISISIRFRDKKQVEKIKRAAKSTDQSFNKYVRGRAEAAAEADLSPKKDTLNVNA